MIEASVLVQNL